MPRSTTSRITRLVPVCLLVLSAGALTGCGAEDDESDKSASTPPSSQAEDSAGDSAPEAETDEADEADEAEPAAEEPAQPGSDSHALVEDAFAGNATIRCTFDQQGVKGTTYIAGTSLRMDSTSPDGEMHMLKVDHTFYMWGDAFPQGMKFEESNVDDSFTEQLDQFSPEEFDKSAEENNIQCEEHSGDDAFDVPSDITFNSMG